MPGHFALWVHYGEAASKSTKAPEPLSGSRGLALVAGVGFEPTTFWVMRSSAAVLRTL